MVFSSIGWLGIRWWIWIYFFFSILAGLSVLIYFKREQIKGKYYQIRYPEKLLKVYIHYKTGLYNIYWRLIPDKRFYRIEKKKYFYEDKLVIKHKGDRFPEIHYYYDNPHPLSFDFTNADVKFSATDIADFEENDLFTKLLTLTQEKQQIMVLIILSVLIFLINAFQLAKDMGWIK